MPCLGLTQRRHQLQFSASNVVYIHTQISYPDGSVFFFFTAKQGHNHDLLCAYKSKIAPLTQKRFTSSLYYWQRNQYLTDMDSSQFNHIYSFPLASVAVWIGVMFIPKYAIHIKRPYN